MPAKRTYEVSCQYADARLMEAGEKCGCPAEQAIWFANTVQQELKGLTPEKIKEEFDRILERALATLFPGYNGIMVAWCPDEEKYTSPKMERDIPRDDDPFTDKLYRVMYRLNSEYHSGRFLRRLAQLPLASSHVYRIRPGPDVEKQSDAEPRSLFIFEAYRLRLLSGPAPSSDVHGNLSFRYSLGVPQCHDTCTALLGKLEALCDSPENKEEHPRIIEEAVRDFCERLPSDAFRLFWQALRAAATKEACEGALSCLDDATFQSDFSSSMRHFALITLVCAAWGYSQCSYFLSPNIAGKSYASMVIYWDKGSDIDPINPPSPVFHSLLQMVLGLNSYHVQASNALQALAEEKVRAKESAIVHFGHSLSHRTSTIARFFRNFKVEDNAPTGYLAKHCSIFIDDLAILLQAANIHSFALLLKHEKRHRFLIDVRTTEDIVSFAEVLDQSLLIAEGPRIQQYCGVKDERWVRLHVCNSNRPVFELGPLPDHQSFQVNPRLLTPIIAELLGNVASCGDINGHEGLPAYGYTTVVFKNIGIYGEKVEGQDAMVICNLVGNPACQRGLLQGETIGGKPSEGYLVRTAEWKPWPPDIVHSGPGLSIDTLRQIELGDLYYRMRRRHGDSPNEQFWFDTALVVRGLRVQEA